MIYNAVVSFTAGWAILETREPSGPIGEGRTQEEVGKAIHLVSVERSWQSLLEVFRVHSFGRACELIQGRK